jgi:MFS family permease
MSGSPDQPNTAATGRVPPLAALAHRDFRLLYLGLLVSMMGSQMARVTSAWQVYDLTGSAVALGLAGLFAALPLIPASLLGGALADAVERRRLMLVMQGLMLLTSGALAVLTAVDAIQVWHIYAANFIMTITGVLDRPARQALIPSLVPREHLLNAYTLMTTLIQAGGLVGPVIAGVVLATLGPTVAYSIDAASFLAVMLALVVMTVPPLAGGGRKVSLGSIAEGLQFVWSKQLIVGLFGLDIAAMLFGYYPTLLPIYAEDILKAGEVGLGLLTAAPAAGSLLGAFIMLAVGSIRRPGWLMLGVVTLYGLALVGLGWSTWLPLSLVFCALLGITDAVSMAIRHTTIQLATPDELRGRVSSAMQISVQGGNSLGAINAGFAAAALGAGPATALGGALVIGATLLFGWLVKPMRTHRL